jgi:Fic family protein
MNDKYLDRHPSKENLLRDVKTISQILLRDTPHHHTGQFRKAPTQTKSDLYAVFPYPPEVEANMNRWAEWTLHSGEVDSVHPLLRAVWVTLYFMSIHPFPDGYGRLSRVLEVIDVARNGLLPVICTPRLDRKTYIRMVVSARSGRPQEWCAEIVKAELNMLEVL